MEDKKYNGAIFKQKSGYSNKTPVLYLRDHVLDESRRTGKKKNLRQGNKSSQFSWTHEHELEALKLFLRLETDTRPSLSVNIFPPSNVNDALPEIIRVCLFVCVKSAYNDSLCVLQAERGIPRGPPQKQAYVCLVLGMEKGKVNFSHVHCQKGFLEHFLTRVQSSVIASLVFVCIWGCLLIACSVQVLKV